MQTAFSKYFVIIGILLSCLLKDNAEVQVVRHHNRRLWRSLLNKKYYNFQQTKKNHDDTSTSTNTLNTRPVRLSFGSGMFDELLGNTRVSSDSSADSSNNSSDLYDADAEATPRIAGGTRVPTKIPYYAWPAAGLGGSSLCGGTLIYEDIILTSAQCKGFWLAAGANLGGLFLPGIGAQFLGVDTELVHPQFNSVTLQNDLMLVKLSTPTTNTPVTLNFNPAVPATGTSLQILGFGPTEDFGLPSSNLLQGTVSSTTSTPCNNILGVVPFDPTKEICASGASNFCIDNLGDIGGPLLTTSGVQVGIMTFSPSCNVNTPGIYTSISAYETWIKRGICDLSANPPSPANCPTFPPTSKPTFRPTAKPSKAPTKRPTNKPTFRPTAKPSKAPTSRPTSKPTLHPTAKPSRAPTNRPTSKPTFRPTAKPSRAPTKAPTRTPTKKPTANPTRLPTKKPTANPTRLPTRKPTTSPVNTPVTTKPTSKPTKLPTKNPTAKPATRFPTSKPTIAPTKTPTKAPTKKPTKFPTKAPTKQPTKAPSNNSAIPTKQPTKAPTNAPTKTPTKAPTKKPTKAPTKNPAKAPTKNPTKAPTKNPTKAPTKNPTSKPTRKPTNVPTKQPINDAPTKIPTKAPTKNPTTKAPTQVPTITPAPKTQSPTRVPTQLPTRIPTRRPSRQPTLRPTRRPTTRRPTRRLRTRRPTTRRPTRRPRTRAPVTSTPTSFPTATPYPTVTASPSETAIGPPICNSSKSAKTGKGNNIPSGHRPTATRPVRKGKGTVTSPTHHPKPICAMGKGMHKSRVMNPSTGKGMRTANIFDRGYTRESIARNL